jgi:cytochrome c-type biogenesis protein CcmF
VTIGGSLILYAVRAPALQAGGLFAPVSREGGLILNNLLLSAACATVFLGTMYPLFAETFGYKATVGAPFFTLTFVPIMIPLVVFMALGPFLSWKRADLAGVLGRLKFAFLAMIAAAALALYLQGGPVIPVLAMGLAAWLFAGALIEWSARIKLFRTTPLDSLRRAIGLPRAAHGMTLAHAGMAVAIAGMVASSAWKVEEILVMQPGDTTKVAGYDYRLDKIERLQGPNYTSDTATITVTRNGQLVAVQNPEKRLYSVQNMPTTEAAIHTTVMADLYTAIGDPDGKGGQVVRIFYEPLVPWIWAGCMMMMLGGAVSLSDRRLRVGAPKRKAPAKLAPAQT